VTDDDHDDHDDDYDDDNDDDDELYFILPFLFHHPSAHFENVFPIKIPRQVHQNDTPWIIDPCKRDGQVAPKYR
jgi:hypothetical protein